MIMSVCINFWLWVGCIINMGVENGEIKNEWKKYNVIKKYNDGSITFTKAKLNYSYNTCVN